MANLHKQKLLEHLKTEFGKLQMLPGSQSLFVIGDNAARIYIRYSKVHERGRTFFGLRDIDLRQLEGHNSFLCFLLDDGSTPVFVPYADFEEVFRGAEVASDGQFKVQLGCRADTRELGPVVLIASYRDCGCQGRERHSGWVETATALWRQV